MLDLAEYGVVDSHCHAFLPERETDSFEQYLTLADHPIPKEDVVNTFLYRQVIRELSRVLGVEGTHEDVVNERHERYKKDPEGYINMLFEDAKIEMLLVDTGYPSKDYSGYSVDLEAFSGMVPSEVREIFRIENLALTLLREGLSLDSMVEEFNTQINNAVKNGAVALKSIIAYRTGLDVKRSTNFEVKKAYKEFLSEVESGKNARNIIGRKTNYVKTLMDHFVFLTLENSVRLGVPFQLHVGIGDVPGIDLRKSKPILLHYLINDEAARDAKIVLTHGGYPDIEEAGFLVNTYPNVYLDLSETIPFISVGIKEKLLNLFEMAPTTKIMYGSDGYNIPELHWISAIQAKKALEAILNGLMESKDIDAGWADEIARQFLSENAKRIYDLDRQRS